MKIFKKITLLITLIIFLVTNNNQTIVFASLAPNSNNRNIANIAVFLNNFDDLYLQTFKQSLEDIEMKNPDKVKFTFFDGKLNLATQLEIIDLVLKSNFDLLIATLMNPQVDVINDVILRAKQNNTPLMILGANPEITSKVNKVYNKVAFLYGDEGDSGTIEGNILVDLWNTNKSTLDKNDDNMLEYVVFQGGNPQALERTKNAVNAINNSGIKTKELQLINAYWSKELAKISMESLFLRYGNKIEVIISNNDAMAIGAIEALQKYGYNTGDTSKYIPVVGIDGLTEAKDLIDKGLMTGTVILNPTLIAEGVYTIGMNLINNVNPTENTNYQYIDNNIIVPLIDKEYTNSANIIN